MEREKEKIISLAWLLKDMLIPSLKKISKIAENWSAASAYDNGKKIIKKNRSQRTIPCDEDLLKKLGLRKSEKILVFAGYYGEWANELANAGCRVVYSDVSKSLTEYARRKYPRIKRAVCRDYIWLPEKEKAYDWSFSFEPVGGKQGLVIAIIRGLMNNKGVKIVHYPRENKPGDAYLRYKLVARVYGCGFGRNSVYISGRGMFGERLDEEHIITSFRTNEGVKRNVREDLKTLISGCGSKDSLKRLSRISGLIERRYLIKT